MATVVAALIGAAIGSLGSQVIAEAYRRREARERSRREAVERYLLQLQDAIESVISRVKNLTTRQGRAVMRGDYYEVSTLYAFGNLLAQKRRLLLGGVYPQLQELAAGLGEKLERLLEAAEREIGREARGESSFQRYDRLALAEAVMERVGDAWTVSSYLQFGERYASDAVLKQALLPACDFVDRLNEMDCASLLETLSAAGNLIAIHTRIPLTAES